MKFPKQIIGYDKPQFIQRQNGCVVKASKNDGTIRYRLSDDSIDREHSRIISSGIDTRSYAQNPIFLWAHNSRGSMLGGSPPDMENVIGRAVSFGVTNLRNSVSDMLGELAEKHIGEDGIAKLEASEAFDIEVEHTPEAINPRGALAFRMVRGGFLNMTSIGARIMRDGVKRQRSGVRGVPDITVFTKTELLEGSLVPIPANANAVVLARAVVEDYDLLDTFDGHDAEDVEKWIAEIRGVPPESVDLTPGEQIARAIRDNLVTGERSSAPMDVMVQAAHAALDKAGFSD